jgi:hypothetical protein
VVGAAGIQVSEVHPDVGGSANQAAEINAAMDAAKQWFAEVDGRQR